MTRLIIDSSFYVSLALDTDSNHLRAHLAAKKITGTKFTTEDFLKESLTVVSQRQGKQASRIFFEYVISDTEILPVTTRLFHIGLEKFLQPELNKNISLIDCIGAATYEDIRADAIASFDSDFKLLGVKVIP